jgi:hypothetical protein
MNNNILGIQVQYIIHMSINNQRSAYKRYEHTILPDGGAIKEIAECTWWPCSDGGVWQENTLHLCIHVYLQNLLGLLSRRKYKIYTIIIIIIIIICRTTSHVAILKLLQHPFYIKSPCKFDYHELIPQLRYSGQNVHWTQTQMLLKLKICASIYR